MRIRVVVAAVALLAGATTSFFGGRYDPPHDEAKVIAELAKTEPSNAIPSDVRLPVVLRARSTPLDGCGDAPRDHINVALSPTTLRVAGRDVLRLPLEWEEGGALVEAMDYEARVLETGGGHAHCVNLQFDESTSWPRAIQIVKSIALAVNLVVRTRAGGTRLVNFALADRQRSEFAIAVTLRGAEVAFFGEAEPVASKNGHVDEETLAARLAELPPRLTNAVTLYVLGSPTYVDVVAVLAALDVVAEAVPPTLFLCSDTRDCVIRPILGAGVTSYGGDLVRVGADPTSLVTATTASTNR